MNSMAFGVVLALLSFLAGQARSEGFLCKECLDLTTTAQEVLTNPDNLESAVDFVKGACGKLPEPYKPKCEDMAEEYTSLVFTTLQEYLTPEKLCLKTGICTEVTKTERREGNGLLRKDNCVLCRYLVLEMKMKLKDPKTQEKLMEYLLRNCHKLQKHEDECKLLVLEYGPQILVTLEALLSDKDLCSTIGMCNKTKALHESM